MVEIIGDPGSCHMSEFGRACQLVETGIEAGLDAVKFQLIDMPEMAGGNIRLPWGHLPILAGRYPEIRIFASAFNREAVQFLLAEGFPEIKFAYSKYPLFLECLAGGLLNKLERIYVSTDTMRPRPAAAPPSVRWLYCIPEYPVRYLVDFEGVFPRFTGFSDHTLGVTQTVSAVAHGARVIEKHFTLDDPTITCPDHSFALRPAALRLLVESLR